MVCVCSEPSHSQDQHCPEIANPHACANNTPTYHAPRHGMPTRTLKTMTRPKHSSLPSIYRKRTPHARKRAMCSVPNPALETAVHSIPTHPTPACLPLPPLLATVPISPTPTNPAAILRRHLQRSRGPVRRRTRTTLWGRLGPVLPLPTPGAHLRGRRERRGGGHGLGRKSVRETRRGLCARRWERGAPCPRDGGSGKEPRGARPIRRVLRRAPREDHRVPPADPGD